MKKETMNISRNFNSALVVKSAGVSFMLLSLTIMFNMFIKLFPVTARA